MTHTTRHNGYSVGRILLTVLIFLLYALPSSAQDDGASQLRYIDKAIREAHLKHDDEALAKALSMRAATFYNLTMSDSIYEHVPKDLQTLKAMGQWRRYYEIWTHLVNTYIYYNGQKNLALREVKAMFDDAMQRNNEYGMGIGYYTMGNVYLNMNNLDESANAYEKGLKILSQMSPLPPITLDVYSYYGDVLNEQRKYDQLEQLTVGWKDFLENFIAQNKLVDAEKDILWFYYDVACVQSALGRNDLKRAEDMLDNAKSHLASEDNYEGGAWLLNMAQLRMMQGRYAEALQLNNRRMNLIAPGEDKAIFLAVALQRASILTQLGRYEESSGLYKEMYEAKDSISNAETKNQLNEMNTLFQVDELKMQQERQQFRNMLIIIGLVVVALVIFIIFRTIAARRLKKAHDQLQATHDELLTAYDQLEETTTAKERIESDLRIARNIQMGMVPSTFPERPDLDLFASMTPAKEVGGDLYGYVLQNDRLYFALGDVSGKGVPASLFMAQATRLFRTLAAQQMMPSDICNQLNEALSGEDNETGMFVTMFIGLADLTTGHLHFCNAGHNPPVLITEGKATFIEMEPNAPIGLWPGLEYVGEEIADITDQPLFVYTDGLNEAENRQQEQFTDERLLEILETTPFENSRQTVEMLCNAVEQHRDGAEPNDDLTMLCVKVKSKQNN